MRASPSSKNASSRTRSPLRKSGDASSSILAAARELLAEDGAECFSIRGLSERCGYSAPTVYHHFGDKNGLLDAVLEMSFRGLRTQLLRIPRTDDPVDIVRKQLNCFVRFGMRHPHEYGLLVTRPPGDPPPAVEECQALLEATLSLLAERGRLIDEPDVLFQSLWALGHGLITLQTVQTDREWSKDLAMTAIDRHLDGAVRPLAENS